MSAILVTGGAGFIGRALTRRLLELGHRVRSLDLRASDSSDAPWGSLTTVGVDDRIGDVRDPATVASALDGIDVVCHLAARTSIVESASSPGVYLSHNVLGTETIARLARGRVRRLILASSRARYGEGSGRCPACGPVRLARRERARLAAEDWDCRCPHCDRPVAAVAVDEACAASPVSIYGLTKKAQEELADVILAGSDTTFVALRLFNVYGAAPAAAAPYPSVASAFARCARRGEPFRLFEDGHQLRDFVHLDDVVSACVHGLDAPPGCFNIGTGVPVTLRDFAAAFAREVGRAAVFASTDSTRVGDVRHSYADTTFARRRFGWHAAVALDQGVAALLRACASTNTSR